MSRACFPCAAVQQHLQSDCQYLQTAMIVTQACKTRCRWITALTCGAAGVQGAKQAMPACGGAPRSQSRPSCQRAPSAPTSLQPPAAAHCAPQHPIAYPPLVAPQPRAAHPAVHAHTCAAASASSQRRGRSLTRRPVPFWPQTKQKHGLQRGTLARVRAQSDAREPGTDSEGNFTRESLLKLTKVELKDMLAERALQLSGIKAVLIERLLEYERNYAAGNLPELSPAQPLSPEFPDGGPMPPIDEVSVQDMVRELRSRGATVGQTFKGQLYERLKNVLLAAKDGEAAAAAAGGAPQGTGDADKPGGLTQAEIFADDFNPSKLTKMKLMAALKDLWVSPIGFKEELAERLRALIDVAKETNSVLGLRLRSAGLRFARKPICLPRCARMPLGSLDVWSSVE